MLSTAKHLHAVVERYDRLMHGLLPGDGSLIGLSCSCGKVTMSCCRLYYLTFPEMFLSAHSADLVTSIWLLGIRVGVLVVAVEFTIGVCLHWFIGFL